MEHIDVGVIRLRIAGARGPETDAALAYWDNYVAPSGELVFARSLKRPAGRHGAGRTGRHLAQSVAAEVTGLACSRCGGPLPSVPVTSRAEACRVWQYRHSPDPASSCRRCSERIRTWIRAADHRLPPGLGPQTVLAAEALRHTAAWGERISGQELLDDLAFSDVRLLVNNVLVPCAVLGDDAVSFSADGTSAFHPARIIWVFAGEGPPAQRLRAFERQLDALLAALAAGSFGDIACVAAGCIQDEALNYFDRKLREHSRPQLEERDQAWVRQLVSEHWGRLDLADFCALIDTACRTAGRTGLRRIGLRPAAGSILSAFRTGLEQATAGSRQPRTDKKPDLEYLPRSVAVFHSVLHLDILHTRPEDIERRRPAAATATDLRMCILHFIEVLQPKLSDQQSELLNRFAEIYCRNALTMNDTDAFTAACNGLAYLTGLVPDPVLTELRKALPAIRHAAAQK